MMMPTVIDHHRHMHDFFLRHGHGYLNDLFNGLLNNSLLMVYLAYNDDFDNDNENDNRLGKGPLAFLYHNQLVWDRESWPRKKTHSSHCCMELSFQGMAEA